MIEQIEADEGPISLNLKACRITGWWGIGRMTSRPLSRIKKVATKASVKKIAHKGVTSLWSKDANPAAYDTFRFLGEGDARRGAQQLAPEEVATSLLYVVRNQVGLPREDLVCEGARLLGYQRTGNVVERYAD